jgi:hypothetical protein
MYNVIYKSDGGWHFLNEADEKNPMTFATVNAAVKHFMGCWANVSDFKVISVITWDAVESPCQ